MEKKKEKKSKIFFEEEIIDIKENTSIELNNENIEIIKNAIHNLGINENQYFKLFSWDRSELKINVPSSNNFVKYNKYTFDEDSFDNIKKTLFTQNLNLNPNGANLNYNENVKIKKEHSYKIKNKNIYCLSTTELSKIEIKIPLQSIKMSDSFMTKFNDIKSSTDLYELLNSYDKSFPISFVLGGRYTIEDHKRIKNKDQVDEVKKDFNTEINACFSSIKTGAQVGLDIYGNNINKSVGNFIVDRCTVEGGNTLLRGYEWIKSLNSPYSWIILYKKDITLWDMITRDDILVKSLKDRNILITKVEGEFFKNNGELNFKISINELKFETTFIGITAYIIKNGKEISQLSFKYKSFFEPTLLYLVYNANNYKKIKEIQNNPNYQGCCVIFVSTSNRYQYRPLSKAIDSYWNKSDPKVIMCEIDNNSFQTKKELYEDNFNISLVSLTDSNGRTILKFQ